MPPAINYLFSKHKHGESAENPAEGLVRLLAALEAASMVHQSHHWQTSGKNFYGDHLLFQKLYEGTSADIDTIAEKLVGISGDPANTNYFLRMAMMKKCMDKWTVPGASYGVVSLAAENDLIALGTECLEVLRRNQVLTIGTENLIAGILDKHETFIYLLQQRNSNH
jgi:DNA-binding ferritin-like protein